MEANSDTPKLNRPVSEEDHIQGSSDAVVTLVEYGDYQCPDCGRAYPIVKQIQEKMGDRMRFVFRNFPLTRLHENAQHAAEAAEAAASQGKFWPMHDILYENQQGLDDEHLREYASNLGLDVDKFKKEMDDHAYAEKVHDDFLDGVKSGVNGTPTFFINGVRHNGLYDLEVLLEKIEKEMG